MRRFLRKARGALRNPVRALRIIGNETMHKAVVRLFYGMRRTCDFVVSGIPISFRTDDCYSKEWFFPRCDHGRFHEPAVTTLLASLVTKDTTSFVDVGAHLGYFSVVAGKLMGDRPVLAFEMDDRALVPLERNVKHNNLTNTKVIHAAITGSSGPVSYRRLPLLDSGESIAFPGSDDPSATVEGYTLDQVCKEHGIEPGIIKIDVEGAEGEVLKGMRETLAKKPILLLEIHGRKLGSFGSNAQEVIQVLAQEGFRVYEIVEHRTGSRVQLRELSPTDEPFTRNTMCLVVHEDMLEEVLARSTSNGSAREHFNSVAGGAEYATYEQRRWQADPRLAVQQEQTKEFLQERVVSMLPSSGVVLELGPGPGTWSKILAQAQPAVQFVFCDISREMLTRATAAVGSDRVLATYEGDFGVSALPATPVQFFFSSRAFEYLADKKEAVARVDRVLAAGGRGCITTKMPKRIMNVLSGRQQSSLHSGQIQPQEFVRLLKEQEYMDIRVYPVTFAVPLLRSAKADHLLGSWLRGPLHPLSALFAESYGVCFRKP